MLSGCDCLNWNDITQRRNLPTCIVCYARTFLVRGPLHIPSLINIANKWVTDVCCDDTEVVTGLHCWHAVTGRQWGVVTLAPSPDMHRWCPHDMSMISVQLSVCHCQCGYQSGWEENTYELKNVTREDIFLPIVELWESLFPCDILRSRCSEYVTFHVDCTGVHTACTPCVHVYTPSRTIHSVVRRPQRGPHRWSSLCENKWNNEIRTLLQLTGLITVKNQKSERDREMWPVLSKVTR